MAVSAHRMDRDRAAEIYRPVQQRLTKVEDQLRDLACVDFPFLADMLAHVYGAAGKRVRPAITLLSASFHPHDEYKLEVMATAVELLHIATLIHDDTVDNSDFRRGRATISSMFGKDIAVLVGDYVFASSATFVCDTGHVGVIRRFSETIMELSSGELMERVNSRNASQTLDDYHNRIYSKTASLFSMAAETGATLSGAPQERDRRAQRVRPRAGNGLPNSGRHPRLPGFRGGDRQADRQRSSARYNDAPGLHRPRTTSPRQPHQGVLQWTRRGRGPTSKGGGHVQPA